MEIVPLSEDVYGLCCLSEGDSLRRHRGIASGQEMGLQFPEIKFIWKEERKIGTSKV